MALTETLVLSHDIRGKYKTINEITDTFIYRDDVEISSVRHRGGPISPGTLADPEDLTSAYVPTDVSGYSADVQGLATACWSSSVHEAYEASLRA